MDAYPSPPSRGLAARPAATPSSPNLSRLDRILDLVTDHESSYRTQDARINELAAKLGELEGRLNQDSASLWSLKERDVGKELDMARTAVETVVRQMATINRSNQALRSDLQSAASRQAQWQLSADALLTSLGEEVGQLRARLDATQDAARQGLETVRSAMGLQLQAHKQEVDEQLQSVLREVRSEVASLRSQLEGGAALAAARGVESWARGEMVALTGKVKAVVQAAAGQQDQVALQMEALQQQWEETTATVEGLAAEGKRLKKHVVRLQNSTEELQRLGQQATASEVMLQQLKSQVQQLHEATKHMGARLEVAASTSGALGLQVQEAGSRVARVEDAVVSVAESVGGCLSAVRAESAAAAAAGPSSYLSSLLAPPPTSRGSALAAAAAAAAGPRQSTGLDAELAAFDAFVAKLRKRLDSNEQQRQRIYTSVSSPIRRHALGSPGG